MSDINGVVAILVNKEGRVICAVSDFETGGYGGFTLEQAQKIRCDKRMAREAIDEYSSRDLADNLDQGTKDRILSDLLRNGFTIHYETIGHKQ